MKEYRKLTRPDTAYIIKVEKVRRGSVSFYWDTCVIVIHVGLQGGKAMRKTVKILSIITIIGTMMSAMPLTSLAKTSYAAISSVSIRVGTDCKAGDYLPSRPTAVEGTTETQEGTYAAVNSTKYTIDDVDWVSSKDTDNVLKVGAEPKMIITLRSSYYSVGDREYIFKGGYSSSNVSIKGGTFVRAQVKNSGDTLEVTVSLKGIGGDFPTPTQAEWTGSGFGKARWGYEDEADRRASSGYYDVSLLRGSSVVKKLEAHQGTSYDFYPYMTKAGSYSIKVRAVAGTEAQKKYGDKSDWVQSDEIYIDKEHVSDGTGQNENSNSGQVGWIQNGSIWYYRYPDGSYQKNSWAKINDKWYLFDTDGKMLTGWQMKNNRYYFLDSSGAMMVGWVKNGDKWYYLNSNAGDLEGAMCVGWIQVNGLIYYMNSSGAMVEGWQEVEGNWYYFYPGSGQKAVNTTISGFYVDDNGIWKK